MSKLPPRVRIVEVGPRDGLQNEPLPVPTTVKLAFIAKLVDAGLKDIEVTSFVSPKAVPQLADAGDVMRALPRPTDVVYSVLVPNIKGLERAIEAGAKRIAVFTAASETFTQKNIGMTIAQSLDTFREVVARATERGISARGYISTAFVCPYAGDTDKERVRAIASSLLDMGIEEIAISDTIGAAAPTHVAATVQCVLADVPAERIALHFHDTYGTALANVYAGLQLGVTTFDSSTGGLGGCPFAPGAAGNVATEDLVYFLHRMGIETGVDTAKVVDAASIIADALQRPLRSAQWRMRPEKSSTGRR